MVPDLTPVKFSNRPRLRQSLGGRVTMRTAQTAVEITKTMIKTIPMIMPLAYGINPGEARSFRGRLRRAMLPDHLSSP